jgi:uncharacterized protein
MNAASGEVATLFGTPWPHVISRLESVRLGLARMKGHLAPTALIASTLSGCVHVHVTEDRVVGRGYAAIAPKALRQLTGSSGYSARPVDFSARDGVHLHGLLLERPGNDVTVLYFGGNGFQIGRGGREAGRLFETLATNVLLIDYRGSGESEGSPTLQRFQTDGLDAFDFLRAQRQPSATRIVVHGLSLGSLIAAYVAAQRPIDGLVLESPLPDIPEYAANQVPWYARPFVRLTIAPTLLDPSNLRVLRAYHGPLLLVTGSADDETPPGFVDELFRASATAAGDRHMFIASRREHGDAFGDSAAVDEYKKFIAALHS